MKINEEPNNNTSSQGSWISIYFLVNLTNLSPKKQISDWIEQMFDKIAIVGYSTYFLSCLQSQSAGTKSAKSVDVSNNYIRGFGARAIYIRDISIRGTCIGSVYMEIASITITYIRLLVLIGFVLEMFVLEMLVPEMLLLKVLILKACIKCICIQDGVYSSAHKLCKSFI